MVRTPDASAIVLAGGRSSRFGRDKLAEPIDGQPLLLHAIGAVRALASEVLVIAAPDSDPAVPGDVVVVHDPSPYGGPLAGLAAGLRAATEPVCLIVGGDSPTLVPGVLGLLVAALADEAIDAAALDDDGRLRPLPSALRREPALNAADGLLADGQRRLRLVFEALTTRTIPEAAWHALDPTGATLRDIDTPEDLAKF
jgi:molybdopterin-guanine dinucleotide biosynthesis protein A